ncbi:hypothetical protein DEIPH_ctg063orf0002 [Deinococcus phoenicis]|uniref:Uncharacterized protein n=1 Tax=Deinococcus phoenicis TaxID=1476583 RepID=A0A016QLI4_9DEIO|nr:hypothetical protein DEIPH_ctg063orf0002 [Deinococcus phoenicis]
MLAVAAYLAGIGAVTVQVLTLRRRQRVGRGVVAPLLTVLALAYIVMVALDAASVITVLTNGADDIPPSSALRTGVIAAWIWLLWVALPRLAYGPTP